MSKVTIEREPTEAPIFRVWVPNIYRDKTLVAEKREGRQVKVEKLPHGALFTAEDMLAWAKAVVEMLADE